MLNVIKLYDLMKEKDIKNIYDLSRQAKIPYSTLIYMVNGHDMYVGTLMELSKFFGVKLESLLNVSYGIGTYSEKGYKYHDTRSFTEAMMSTYV